MRVRFLNEYLGDTSLTVLEVGAIRLEDTLSMAGVLF